MIAIRIVPDFPPGVVEKLKDSREPARRHSAKPGRFVDFGNPAGVERVDRVQPVSLPLGGRSPVSELAPRGCAQSFRRRSQASSSSRSCLAKQKRSKSYPRPWRKNAEPATEATPVAASKLRDFSAALRPVRRLAWAST